VDEESELGEESEASSPTSVEEPRDEKGELNALAEEERGREEGEGVKSTGRVHGE
jgi:hypothetical protein